MTTKADTAQGAARRQGVRAIYNALRIQIIRFEESFVQMHGRPPKGSIEKAPIKTTYAQYRELKWAIRGDAARRIQALFRGWKTRSGIVLNRNENMTGDWNERFNGDLSKEEYQTEVETSISGVSTIDEIRGPEETIGNARVEETSLQYHDDGYYYEHASTESAQHSEASASFESDNSAFSDVSEDELDNLSLKELRVRKRELKELLKDYDIQFTLEHGRMPNKSEKEPIRHLYTRYNAIKDRIATMSRTFLE